MLLDADREIDGHSAVANITSTAAGDNYQR